MKGGCFCGSVRYELTLPLQQAYYCHCRDCQYFSGSAFHVLGVTERDAIRLVSGTLSKYRYVIRGGSEMKREFCKECGTPLFVISSRFQEIRMFSVSTLDEPESIAPSFEIWTCSKVSWADVQSDITSFLRGASD